MKKLDVGTVAFVVGLFTGGIHLLWSLMVMLGWGQTYLDWIFGLHFLNNPFTVAAFNMSSAVVLVVFTFIVGYLLGWIFTWIWNRMIARK